MSELVVHPREAALDRLMNTIQLIVSSGAVIRYKTGITLNHKRRRYQYASDKYEPYPHFVILETRLTREEALILEEKIHYEVVEADGRSSLYRNRYVEAYAKYTPSDGAPKREGEYSIYLVWK